jgi:hypothetical protein
MAGDALDGMADALDDMALSPEASPPRGSAPHCAAAAGAAKQARSRSSSTPSLAPLDGGGSRRSSRSRAASGGDAGGRQ